MNKSFQSHTHTGFVILFVVLIASIILLIGAGIFTISFKQSILASTAKESQLAFAAADAGVECALYYDQLGQISITGSGIECAGESISVPLTNQGFVFDVSMKNLYGATDNMPCARVLVDKNYTENATLYTRIISRGYNICDENNDPVIESPILLERVLDVKYINSVVTGGTIPTGGGTASPTSPDSLGGMGTSTGSGTIPGTSENPPVKTTDPGVLQNPPVKTTSNDTSARPLEDSPTKTSEPMKEVENIQDSPLRN